MNEQKRGQDYAMKRSQAIQNMEQHVQKILFPVARSIVQKASKYKRAGKLSNERAVLAEARTIAAKASAELDRYTSAYSLASCRLLGIDSKDVSDFISGDIYGKTLAERNATYLANFAEDIVRMVKAGTLMSYSDNKILSAVRTGYKDPYHTSVITKARRKDINIATPSYGRGIFHNAYENIVRNSTQTISLAWGQAEQQYGKENGATGFRVFRGSSYPCAVCDDECAYVHTFRDPHPPFHCRCKCRIEFVVNK